MHTDGPIGSVEPTSTLADRAFSVLRARLVRCQISPGARFTEAELMRSERIGKTPLREALAKLEYLGLVRSLPRIGYEATPITLSGVRDVFELRLVVEPPAARAAAGRTDSALLRRLQQEFRESDASTPAGFERFLEANRTLHMHIAQAAENRRLARVIEEALDASERIYRVGLAVGDATRIVHDHGDLIDALERGSPRDAELIARREMIGAKEIFFEIFLSSPSIQGMSIEIGERRRASAG